MTSVMGLELAVIYGEGRYRGAETVTPPLSNLGATFAVNRNFTANLSWRSERRQECRRSALVADGNADVPAPVVVGIPGVGQWEAVIGAHTDVLGDGVAEAGADAGEDGVVGFTGEWVVWDGDSVVPESEELELILDVGSEER